MSNKFSSLTEKRIAWRKRINLRESVLQAIQRDADVAMRTEAQQIQWIIEEHYKRQGEGAHNV